MAAALQEPPRNRLSIALSTAIALHVACAVFGYRLAKNESRAPLVTDPLAATEIEVFELGASSSDLTVAKEDELSGRVALTTTTSAERAERRVAPAPAAAREPRETPAVPLNPTSDSEGQEGAEGYALNPAEGAKGGGPRAEKAVNLGIGSGDWSQWVDPTGTPRIDRPPAPRAELATPASSTGGLAEALEAHDQQVGIGPAGAVLSAVHDAGYSEVAPAISTATFSITVLRSGVIDVQLTSVTSQRAAWTKVGDNIVAAIRKKPPQISPSRNGVRLSIEVVAEERWPNGQIARFDHGPKVAVKAPKFQAVDEAKEELLDRNPTAVPDPDAPAGKTALKANVDMPGVFLEGKGKVCSYRIGLSPTFFSGGCDPSNIGAMPRRVVSTRIINQSML
ncbi:MAG: hypothetical protein ABW133_24940 [Polyangiaceae bacterium]